MRASTGYALNNAASDATKVMPNVRTLRDLAKKWVIDDSSRLFLWPERQRER
jgi:hypothetical protein